MEEVKSEILDFLGKCEEVKSSKFIMALTRIGDLLKSIVNSRTLYDLFNSVTTDFDYKAAQSRCFVKSSDGFRSSGKIVLPGSRRDKLAFIFCLLVDIDRETINFNDFLQRYFSDDGSFYSCFHAFCEQIIDPLARIIKDAYSQMFGGEVPSVHESSSNVSPAPHSELSTILSTIYLLICQEKQYILESAIPDDDKETGYKMLTEVYNALKDCNFEVANSLVNGYNYYILYNNTISPNVQTLFESIRAFEDKAA